MNKKIVVLGAGGFIGTHLVNSLKSQGHYVVGADLKTPEFSVSVFFQTISINLRLAYSFLYRIFLTIRILQLKSNTVLSFRCILNDFLKS